MPQVSIYVKDSLYIKLLEAGDGKSKTIEKALLKYFEGDK